MLKGEGEDPNQFITATLDDESHHSITILREDNDDNHQSISTSREGNDDSHQSINASREGRAESHQSSSIEEESKVDSEQSISVPRVGKNGSQQTTGVSRQSSDDIQQSSSRLCPASPEPPPLPEDPPPLPEDPPSAKDKGYAWVVVWVSFSVNVFTAGYIKSFGIMYLLLMQYFPNASGAEAGWIMGLLFGTRGLLSPITGALTVKLGGRLCCLIGTACVTFGLLLAIPLFSVLYIAVTLGGLVGFGLCLCETPGILLVNDYFLERRSSANGLRAAGNPMGGILFPPLLVFLSRQYGLQGTFIMMAGIMMQMAVLGTLLRPFEQHERMIHLQHIQARQSRPSTTATPYGLVAAHRHNKHPSKKKALDFTLFKNPQYLIYIGVAMSLNLALPNFLVYIPAYANSVGLTEYQVSIITSYVSGIDFAFRLLCGLVIDKLNLNEARLFVVGLMVGGLGCFLVPLCSAMWQLMLATTLFSFGLAIFWALLNTLLANQFGSEMTASTWGFFRMMQGITNFLYPSLLGLIKDVTGGYVVPFLVMGSGFLGASFVFLLQPLAAKLSNRNT